MFNRKARSWEGKHAQLAETDETTQPKRPVQQLVERDHSTEALAQPIQAHQLSYHSTGWAYTDLALEMIDKFTGGHADWIQRAFSYLLFGGFAAIVQLIFFYIMYYRVPLPVDQPWHYVIAFAVANEVANLANFFSNDLITFRYLPGHTRHWFVRCTRYHMTCVAGTLLQLVISFSLYLLMIPALLTQAGAILIVTAFNFIFHHIFTYRRVMPHGKS